MNLPEVLTLSLAQRVAAMLDIDPATIAVGDRLPRGWHFPLMPAVTRKSDIRADGFPGLGVPMPDLGLPKLVLGGREVQYNSDLFVGDAIERRSAVIDIVKKGEGGKARAVVMVRHELFRDEPDPAIVETQQYLLLPEGRRYSEPERSQTAIRAEHIGQFSADSTLLFHYCALGFNSHKIHLDRDYARDVEGYPDLVVNGGLAALLVSEFVRNTLGGIIASLTMKHQAPLFCNAPMTFAADRAPGGWALRIHDEAGRLAATAEAQTI